MSSNQLSKSHLLPPSEISKRILDKPHKARSQSEWFDHLGKYRDEHLAEYARKQSQFLAAVDDYNRMNMETLSGRKVRLHANYEEMINTDFLKDEKERGEDEVCFTFSQLFPLHLLILGMRSIVLLPEMYSK